MPDTLDNACVLQERGEPLYSAHVRCRMLASPKTSAVTRDPTWHHGSCGRRSSRWAMVKMGSIVTLTS
uniref:Uncharacterized protein n=1 Tax=Leersia perrieri TaxID=77586 RepID=A0A0D9X206_9ORYZ